MDCKPRRIFGVDFAPLNVPLERRIQTLSTAYMSFTYFFVGFAAFWLLWKIFWTPYWFLVIVYVLWVVVDNKWPSTHSRLRSTWARNWTVYKLLRDYFPIQLHKTCDLDPNRSYLCGYHPHGVMPSGGVIGFGTDVCGVHELFPGLTPIMCGLGVLFWVPGYREFVLSLGARNVDRDMLNGVLTQPRNLAVVVVGGTAESLEGDPGRYILILKKRKGFVREAIRAGADLIPVFCFGENYIFPLVHQKPGSFGRRIQEGIKRYFGLTIPFFRGRGFFQYTFGVLPHRHPLNVVVGAPIRVVKDLNPTKEDIDEMHAKYVVALEELFEKHKPRFEPHATLEIR